MQIRIDIPGENRERILVSMDNFGIHLNIEYWNEPYCGWTVGSRHKGFDQFFIPFNLFSKVFSALEKIKNILPLK